MNESITPDREVQVTHCRCCGQPFQKIAWQQGWKHIPGKFIIECKTSGCDLKDVTVTDVDYIESTDPWLTQIK